MSNPDNPTGDVPPWLQPIVYNKGLEDDEDDAEDEPDQPLACGIAVEQPQ